MLLRFPTENEVAYIYPDSEDFDDHWEKALAGSDGAHRVYSDLRSVHQWIEAAQIFDEDPLEKIQALIENTEECYSALGAILGLAKWETRDNPYYDMRAAIHLLDRVYEDSTNCRWYYVTAFSLELLVSAQRRISHDCSLELQRAVEQLETLSAMDDIPLGTFGDLTRLLVGNSDILESETQTGTRALGICIEVANRLHKEKDYLQERHVLKDTIELASIINADTDGLKRRYVDTFRSNSIEQGERSSMLKASELLRGLNDEIVQSFLSDSGKKEWKKDLREAAEAAARGLRRGGAKIEYPEDDTLHKQQIEEYIERFEQIARVEDTQAALFWLLTDDLFLPDPDQDSENAPILEEISTIGLSYSGHMIEFDPDEADISSHYVIDTMIRIPLLVSVFSSLIADNEIFEADLYNFINQIPDLDSNSGNYLTKIVHNVFEHRYAESIHLGVPQMESILYSHLLARGEDVDALMDEGTGTRTLGSLLPLTKEHLGEQFGCYLEYMYNEPVGQLLSGNLRNRVAHGLLLPTENDQYRSMLILIDLLRIIARFNKTHFYSKYGIPATVTYGPSRFKLAIKSYRESPDITDQEILDFIESDNPTITELADEFDVPYSLAHSRIQVLEAVDSVEVTPKDEDYICRKT